MPIDEEPGVESVIGIVGESHHHNLGMLEAIRSAFCRAHHRFCVASR